MILTRARDARISPALEPIYRLIESLSEPDRSVFVHDLQRYCAGWCDLPLDVRIRKPR